jgi:DNA-binding transcriptional LysR family regulator
MELRHLRYFVAVAEELHFSRAAERLHISTPALTEQIQKLEQELGAHLLMRTKRNVALTDAGARFLEEARSTLRQAERAALVGKLAGRGEVGRIEIGYVSSAACAGLLPAAVAVFRREYPLVNLSLWRMETAGQLDHLAEGRLDVGLLRPAARYPLGITSVIIAKQSIAVALPTDHKFAALKSVSAAMLAEERFIAPTFETELGIYQRTAAVGQQGKFVARIVDRAPDLFTVVTLVAAGAGIAVVPESCSCIQIPGVVYKLLSPQTKPAELAVAFRRDERAPAVKAFIQCLRTYRLNATRAGRSEGDGRLAAPPTKRTLID